MVGKLLLIPRSNLSSFTRSRAWLWIIVLLYAATQIYTIEKLSLNHDEPLFASYGISILKREGKKDVIYYESKLPIVALNMIPRAAEQVIQPGLKKGWPETVRDIINGRYITLAFTILLALLVFSWSRKLYGEKVSGIGTLFFLLCPNFLGHGFFVSTDIYAALFLTSSVYFLWKYCRTGSNRDFFLMALSVAFAQISKFSMLHLFIIIPLILLFQFLLRTAHERQWRPGRFLMLSAVFLLTNWIVISAAHLFYGMFMPLGEYSFLTPAFKKLQQAMSWMPMPLPSSYVQSIDAVLYFDKLGGGVPGAILGPIYILGESSAHGFWYYYLVVLFFKMPIPVLLIWAGTFILFFRRFRDRSFLARSVFFLFPFLYYLVYLSGFYGTQIGIRHLMIVFPLMYIFSGELLSILSEKKPVVIAIALVWTAVSVLFFFPHFLPYTNEFIWDKKTAYKRISQSNLSYGEGVPYLEEYLKKHRDVILHPEKPTSGKVIMEVGNITNVSVSTMYKYDWVKDLKPVDHVHSQYIVFNVEPRVADSLRKLRTFK